MIDFLYLGIIGTLVLVIFILMRKINLIKKEHRMNLAKLYKILSDIAKQEEKSSQKLQLNKDLNLTIKDNRKRLSTDIFDLQMDIFRKITEN